MRLSAFATERISSGPRSGSGARRPQPEQGDADHGEQQRHHPRVAHERRTLPLIRQDVGRYHRAVRQRDAELAGLAIGRERKDPIAVAEAPVQAAQVDAVRLGCRWRHARRDALDAEQREGARDIAHQPRPI
jgi:hypothetical protein